VLNLLGLGGRDVSFRVLVVFSLKEPLKKIEKIIQPFKFKKIDILHPIQGLLKLHLVGAENSVFIDVGGNNTQISLIKNAKFEQTGNFEIGGKNFSEGLAEVLGQGERDGRELKEKYSNGQLSIEVQTRVSEILAQIKINWYKKLKDTISKINRTGILPSDFYLFGGGAKLSEIQRVLEEESWQGVNFSRNVRVHIFSLKDFYHYLHLKVKDLPSSILTNSQYIPSFLIFYARENF
ncbi:MAG: cell division FtsA domain-containing protein, partial [Patescibacteria group bacterium]